MLLVVIEAGSCVEQRDRPRARCLQCEVMLDGGLADCLLI